MKGAGRTTDDAQRRYRGREAFCEPIGIEVVRHDGEPVPGARLQVTTRDLYNSPLDYTTDRLGRLQFPLPDGEVRVGAFLRDGGVATELVRVPPQADDPGLSPLRLQLTRPIRVCGMVVDHKGKPIAGAVVYPWNRPEGGDRQLADLAFDAQQPSAPTSSDGAFAVNLPMGDVTARIRGAVSVDGKWAWSPELPLVLEQRDLDGVRLVIDLAEIRR